MCKKKKSLKGKECLNIVVDGFLFRGGTTTTRQGVLVVIAVGSCLGDLSYVGIKDGDLGSGNIQKRVDLIKKGEGWPSKEMGIQGNHKGGN